MPTNGYKRYFKLFKNIQNPGVYLRNKVAKPEWPLHFITKPNAIQLNVPANLFLVFKEIFMSDVYDIEDLIKMLPEQPIVVDIGANVGFFDFILLSKIKAARIYAYEPMPANVSLMNKTINENKLESYISLHQMAVTGNPKDSIELFVEDASDNTVIASVFENFNDVNTKKISVPCISYKEIVTQNKLGQIDILKVDCEGSEFDIFYNTPPEMIQLAKVISVEIHDLDTDKNNINYFNKFIQSLGYTTTHTQINGFCHALTAIKQS